MKAKNLLSALLFILTIHYSVSAQQGCTDPDALNYSSLAEIDNGLCCYDTLNYFEIFATGPTTLDIFNGDTGTWLLLDYPYITGFCTTDSCFRFFFDNLASNGLNVKIRRYGGPFILDYTYPSNGFNGWYIHVDAGGTPGCTNYDACNYNPSASCSDFMLCDYSCYGCTDPTAGNFDPDATLDDESCCDSSSIGYIISSLSKNVFYAENGTQSWHLPLYVEAFTPTPICLDSDCFSLYINAADEGINFPCDFIVINAQGDTLAAMTEENYTANLYFSNVGFTSGCTMPGACNYDPNATCYNFQCDYSCYGCTDPDANNFDPTATLDNGYCCYHTFKVSSTVPIDWESTGETNSPYITTSIDDEGNYIVCTARGCSQIFISVLPHSEAGTITIYDENDEIVDLHQVSPNSSGSMNYSFSLTAANVVYGCMQPEYCSYDPLANCNVEAYCDPFCYGCTDPTAPNYDPDAWVSDNSCCYDHYYRIETDNGVSFSVQSNDYNSSYDGLYPLEQGFCMPDECFTVYLWNSNFSDFPMTIFTPAGDTLFSGILSTNAGGVALSFSMDAIFGCTNPDACNYNPLATCSVNEAFACDYSCYGCMDPTAYNYDPDATMSDGLCCYDNYLSIYFSAPNSWSSNSENGNQLIGLFPYYAYMCFDGSCTLISSYNFTSEPLEFVVVDALGTVWGSGIAQPNEIIEIPLSSNPGDIPGCTDPTACNFNPDANCDAGGCIFYCWGCTDPVAVNYNPLASEDDGTCQYNFTFPSIQYSTTITPLEYTYSVSMNVLFIGNDAPYVITNNLNNTTQLISSEVSNVPLDTFPCGETVIFTIISSSGQVMNYEINDPFFGNCGGNIIASTPEIKNSPFRLFPNPASTHLTLEGPLDKIITYKILDLSGRVIRQHKLTGQVLQEISLNELNNGYYLLEIHSDAGLTVLPFLISR